MTSIISWNVNGVRAVSKKGFQEWLKTEGPDVLGLQEIKARKEQLSLELIQPQFDSGKYYTYWHSAKRPGYSGTAIFSKKEPHNIRMLGIPEFDDEGRVLVADFETYSFASAYFPNSQAEGARLGYKLDFCAAIKEFMDREQRGGRTVILSGDYNIAHKPIDLANPKRNEKNPGYLPEERCWMDEFIGSGYSDTFRRFHTEPEQYTWWSYRFKAREKNIGWRIDYHCLHETALPRVKESVILASVLGSDHCPIKLVYDD